MPKKSNGQLKTARDPRKKPEKDEIAGHENDIFRDYVGPQLANPDKTLKYEAGGKGLEIYEDLLRDPKVYSSLRSLKLAVVGKEWRVDPASEDKRDVEIADYVKQVLLGFDYDTARMIQLDGLLMGFKAGEVMWDYSEGDVFIKDIKGRSSRRFVFDEEERLRLLTYQNMVDGEILPERKFTIFRNPSSNGSPYGFGLGSILYWAVWFKKNAIKFWMIFADKFGSPTVVGKYPPGTSKDQQDKLLDALKVIQSQQAIKIPDNMLIELLEATRSLGKGALFEVLCMFMNDEIAQVVQGQTLTSDIGDTGSYAASQTHGEVKAEHVKAVADLLCYSANTHEIPWLVDYNFPGVSEYPQLWIRTEPEKDLKALAERDRVLTKDIGVPAARKYFYDTYAIPEPQEGEELITPPAGGGGFPMFSELLNRRRKARPSDYAEPGDWVEKYMARITPSLQGARQAALDSLAGWMKGLSAPPSEAAFTKKVQEILGEAYAAVDTAAVSETAADIYSFYKTTEKIVPGIATGFTGPDVRAAKFLGELDSYYISKFVKNPDAAASIQNFIKEQYLEGGAGLFGRGAEAQIDSFRDLLGQKLVDLEDWQVRRIADTTVQRARNWAHIAQVQDAGITEIEIYEPTKDCALCAAMDGKIIPVENAYSRMMKQAAMKPEEYEAELKMSPPNLGIVDDLVARGELPPYHPHCRGRFIVRSG